MAGLSKHKVSGEYKSQAEANAGNRNQMPLLSLLWVIILAMPACTYESHACGQPLGA